MSCLRNGKQRDSCFVQNKEKNIYSNKCIVSQKQWAYVCVRQSRRSDPSTQKSLWWVNCLKGGAACLSRVSLPTSRQSIVYEWKSWVVYLLTSHTSEPPLPPPTPSEGKSELRDTQLEEWEEVLPSPPMLSDSPSSRTNLSSGGVLSLDSPLTWRNIRKLTFIRPPAVSLLPAVYKCVCFLIFLIVLRESS